MLNSESWPCGVNVHEGGGAVQKWTL